MIDPAVEAFARRRRADAAAELARVKTVLYLAPSECLERLNERAAGLEYVIREYDAYLASVAAPDPL